MFCVSSPSLNSSRRLKADYPSSAMFSMLCLNVFLRKLGAVADQPVQVLDLEQPRLGLAVVARLRPLLLVAAGAERLVPRAREAHDPDLGTRPGPFEAADELVDGPGPEGVEAIGTVDRD